MNYSQILRVRLVRLNRNRSRMDCIVERKDRFVRSREGWTDKFRSESILTARLNRLIGQRLIEISAYLVSSVVTLQSATFRNRGFRMWTISDVAETLKNFVFQHCDYDRKFVSYVSQPLFLFLSIFCNLIKF